MANCPKCGRKLTLFDWKPNCPECGVNLVYYGMEERLMDEADKAEAEHARLQKRIDRLKASFVGSKLAIVRIILSVLPIAALLLPLASISFNGPYIEATTTTINAIEIYNLVSSLDFDALFTMIGSGVVGSSFIGYAGALVGILLSLVFVILSLLLLMLACSPKGCVRNLIMNSLAIVAAVVSIVMFTQFANGITAVFPDFVTDASIGFGIFVYIGMLALLLGLNIYLTINKIEVKYKQCYVGGIPAEEYFELVEKGTDKEILHKMMAEALAEKTDVKEEAKEEVNA